MSAPADSARRGAAALGTIGIAVSWAVQYGGPPPGYVPRRLPVRIVIEDDGQDDDENACDEDSSEIA